ncbi:MAG: YveK family protein [Acidimicrobiales bacterium]
MNPSAWQTRLRQTLAVDPVIALVVGVVLAVGLGVLAAALSVGGTRVYQSTTTMLIDDPLALATAGSADQVYKLEQLRSKYAGLASTGAIAGPVAQSLGVPIGNVLGAISVDQPQDSLLMDITASSANSAFAQQLSQAVATEITTYVENEERTYQVPPAFRFTITTIDPATPPYARAKSASRATTAGIGAAVLAFLFGFGGTQLIRNRDLLV